MAASSSYEPDDAGIELSRWNFCAPTGAELRAEVAAIASDISVAQIAGLRRRYPQDALHAALALAKIQPRARKNFPGFEYVWATPEALEQASSARVAAHKAARFAAAGASRIIDFCSGIGGDALALAQIGLTFAVDQSEIRVACLRFNSEDHPSAHPIRTITAKIENLLEKHAPLPKEAFIHVDPARRSDGKRGAEYEDLIPPPETLGKIFALYPNGALKLSSAVDFDSLPEGHLELISENRTVVQAVLWRGKLTGLFPVDTRTASILSTTAAPFIFSAAPHEPRVTNREPRQFLYEVDGALTRSQLAAPFADSLSLTPLTSDAGYVLSDISLSHPALSRFKLHTIVPFSEERVTEALLKLEAPAGPVEVKSRGAPPGVDTDQLQILWSKQANRKLSVLLFRSADDILAAIATRG